MPTARRGTASLRCAALVLSSGLALTLSACGDSPSSSSGSAATSAGAVSAQHGEADIAFIQDMTPHHESAVAMSELVTDRSDNPAVTALASRIVAGQGPEIAQMQKMAKAWKVELVAGHSSGTHTGMDMDMSGATELEPLKGAAFDRAFLTEMITHHEAALPMSQAELDMGESPQAKVLAQQIVATQTSEIAEMKQLLTSI